MKIDMPKGLPVKFSDRLKQPMNLQEYYYQSLNDCLKMTATVVHLLQESEANGANRLG